MKNPDAPTIIYISYVMATNGIRNIAFIYIFKSVFYNPFIIFYHVFPKTIIRITLGEQITKILNNIKNKIYNK